MGGQERVSARTNRFFFFQAPVSASAKAFSAVTVCFGVSCNVVRGPNVGVVGRTVKRRRLTLRRKESTVLR